MRMTKRSGALLVVSALLTSWSWVVPATAAEAKQPAKLVLKKGDRVAIVGDSITEQKLYSKFMEVYLLACVPELELKVMQFGWGGETAGGFAGRMDNDLLPWRPSVVTTCYGMNDGRYTKYTDAIGQAYEGPMRRIVEQVKKASGTMVVGAPGVVDSHTYDARPRQHPSAVYNENLKQLASIAAKIAKDNDMPFADVHGDMMSAMTKAKAALGEKYHVGGGDGIHPSDNGQLVMAYAFLRAMGLDGDLGTIAVDYAAGKAEASGGHKVLAAEKGAVELESGRYPFCFWGDGKSPGGTVSILPFVPFQQDLNRLRLVVRNLPGAKAKVQWGKQAKEFPAEELAKGINLAAEFLDNPFAAAFGKVVDAVGRKQAFETRAIKSMITSFRQFAGSSPEEKELAPLLDAVRDKLLKMQDKLAEQARAAVQPVRHKLVITPAD
ncbi:MAG TPA: SGNH/GDSL hydrolase family protein [Phycisphaerae bacterium]|nr:SGNH/GDSL hydrolase family protein [Phycisphaerae bacterium]